MPAHLRKLVRHPFIRCHPIVMPALHHERPRRDQHRHLRVVIRVPQIELRHLIFPREHVAIPPLHRDILRDPLVEIRRADRQRVPVQQRRQPHRRLAPVGQPVITNPRRIDKRLLAQPVQNPLVLAQHHREQRRLQRIRLPLQHPEIVLPPIRIMRRERDEAALRQLRRKRAVITEPAALRVLRHRVLRHALQPVLTHHHRSPLARLQIFRHQQIAPRHHARPHVQHHLVARPFRLIINLPRARIRRLIRRGQTPDHLAPQILLKRPPRRHPVIRRRRPHLVPKPLRAHLLRPPHQLLRERLQLAHLPQLPPRHIHTRAQLHRPRRRQLIQPRRPAQPRHQPLQRRHRTRPHRRPLVPINKTQRLRETPRLRQQRPRPLHLLLHRNKIRRLPRPRRRTRPSLPRCRRPGDFRHRRILDHQRPRRDQARDLRVAKLLQQREHIPVNRLPPHLLPRIEIPAHQRRMDPRVHRRAIQRDQPALRVTRHADARFRRPLAQPLIQTRKPIHRRQHLLHLIPDHMPPHFISLPVNPLAMRLIREPPHQRIPRRRVLPVDQRRNDDLTPLLRQPPRQLRLRRQPRRETQQHLRRLIRIRQHHHPRHRRALRLHEQPLPLHPRQHRPPHCIHHVCVRLRRLRRRARAAHVLQRRHRHPRIHHADVFAKPLPIPRHRFFVSLVRGKIPLPQLLPRPHRLLQSPH